MNSELWLSPNACECTPAWAGRFPLTIAPRSDRVESKYFILNTNSSATISARATLWNHIARWPHWKTAAVNCYSRKPVAGCGIFKRFGDCKNWPTMNGNWVRGKTGFCGCIYVDNGWGMKYPGYGYSVVIEVGRHLGLLIGYQSRLNFYQIPKLASVSINLILNLLLTIFHEFPLSSQFVRFTRWLTN